ncbi:exopolysaccharide biosynthesis protein ybjh [Lucifera butyrica]|uniref:Exopolysaccharide biosynthesis protein ybjh n=1 Tax=Lucifera butyrica TaxID=1351585 RepID=A0A498RCK1_9FIRM|nr:YjbH domain-containing protein [Lucifera butyrica]VBB09264.1 exopolysaccharide biosynthesis protein ybjh [Lucifera butyrica]
MKGKISWLVCCLLLVSATVWAAPSTNGSTGLINTPSADVLREGQFSAGYYHLKAGGVGVFDFGMGHNWEIGVAGFRYDSAANRTYLNAKFALAPETVFTPGLAIGVEDIAQDGQRTVYAAASKALPFGFRIHAGIGNGRYDGVFAGIEKTINPVSVLSGNNTFPATTLIAEYDGHYMNYGARLSVVPGMKLDAGWRQHDFYIGMSFTN